MAFGHPANCRFATEKRPKQVDVEHSSRQLAIEFIDGAATTHDSRIVHKPSNRTKTVGRLLKHFLNVCFVRDITLHRNGTTSGSFNFFDYRRSSIRSGSKAHTNRPTTRPCKTAYLSPNTSTPPSYHKNARTAWAMMAQGTFYQEPESQAA